jgi:hypothetical protein
MTHFIILPSLSTKTATTVESTWAKPSFSPASVDLDKEVITASPALADPAEDEGEEDAEAEDEGDLDGDDEPDGDDDPEGAGVGLALQPKSNAEISNATKTDATILFIPSSNIYDLV